MPVESPSLFTLDVSPLTAPTPQPVGPSFDERWAAWRARGEAHDRAVRRKLAIAAPILAVVAAVLYLSLVR